jgi:hypothetical protein
MMAEMTTSTRGEGPFPVCFQADITLMMAEMTAAPRGEVIRSISGLEIFSSNNKINN